MSCTFSHLSRLYNENRFFELTSSPEGLYFLKLRSLGRKKYYLRLFQKAQIPVTDSKHRENELFKTLFNHQINSEIIHDVINEIYTEERQKHQAQEEDLLTELYKLQSFDWGGIHQNDINKYLVDNSG
ncbi:hypothetical protein [uncultured Nostoc sp.]|uniref:hypothetical protein n=1 Tax=uncultured Nostoc sp. TaxID=340711 RepID=UPI0035CB22D1